MIQGYRFRDVQVPPDSERLSFRPLTEDDTATWMEFILNEDAMRFYPYEPSEEYCHAWMQKQFDRYDEGIGGMLAVCDKESKQMIGQCGLLIQNIDDMEELEVGYGLIPKFWGKGFAAEAAGAFYRFGLQQDYTEYVISLIDPMNTSSAGVAQRNGLEIWKQASFKDKMVNVWRKDGLVG